MIVKGLAEQFNAKPTEIKSLFGQFDPVRAHELREQCWQDCCLE